MAVYTLLLHAEFKTLAIRMLSELGGRVDELSENFSKETINIKTELENRAVRNEEYTS